MIETKTIWFDGKFVPWKSAQTHVLTHSLNYGTGIFEGIRCYPVESGAYIFRLRDHINRFFESAKPLSMKIPFSKISLMRAVVETVKRNSVLDVYIRPLAFFGYSKIGPNPADSPVQVIIACIPLKVYLKKKFIKVKTSPLLRISPRACFPHAKITGMYFNSAISSLDAWKSGFDEAIVLDEDGNVAEGAAENLFIVKDGIVLTPRSEKILPGITRETMFKIFKDLKLQAVEKNIALDELLRADEAFFTGTAVEVHSLGQIDRTKLPRKNPITQKIQRYYQKLVRGEIPKYKKWLTKVSL